MCWTLQKYGHNICATALPNPPRSTINGRRWWSPYQIETIRFYWVSLYLFWIESQFSQIMVCRCKCKCRDMMTWEPPYYGPIIVYGGFVTAQIFVHSQFSIAKILCTIDLIRSLQFDSLSSIGRVPNLVSLRFKVRFMDLLDAMCKDHDDAWLDDHVIWHVSVVASHHHHGLPARNTAANVPEIKSNNTYVWKKVWSPSILAPKWFLRVLF